MMDLVLGALQRSSPGDAADCAHDRITKVDFCPCIVHTKAGPFFFFPFCVRTCAAVVFFRKLQLEQLLFVTAVY